MSSYSAGISGARKFDCYLFNPKTGVQLENDRGISMKNDRLHTERRQHKRYQVQRNAFVLLRDGYMNPGQITEISLGGMVFRHNCRNGTSPGAADIDIMVADFTDAFLIRNLPIKAVSERAISGENPIESTGLRKQVVRFGSLSSNQTSRLKYFMRFYTSGSVWSK